MKLPSIIMIFGLVASSISGSKIEYNHKPFIQKEAAVDHHVTIYSSNGEILKETCSDHDYADVYLLDHLRGQMSFGNKAFAIVEHDGESEFVVIDGNCTEWMSQAEFLNQWTGLSSSL